MNPPMNRKMLYIAVTLAVILIIAGAIHLTRPSGNTLILATTTSTYDSGLLDAILPDFEERYDAEVKVVAVGTGQALELGRNGDADVLLVHATELEAEFVVGGHGLYREDVMYNRFVIVGPGDDPAGISGLGNASQAMAAIASGRAMFCSRGDDSGTHIREKTLWESAGLDYASISAMDNSSWYLSLGQGMGDTLRTASEMGAYTLTDEATYYALLDELDLEVMVSDDPALFNQYGVIPVNASMHPGVNQPLAEDFAGWLTSPDTQALIDAYTKDGRKLFTANASGGDVPGQ